MEIISLIWNTVLINPMINGTIVLYRVLFNNYGLAIIVLTLLMRLLTLPLTLQQMRSSRKMTSIQPKLTEIQKKYKDPKRRSEETMKLYKEEGINPAGCVVPMLIQFPIWIALYSVIRTVLADTPESLIGLSIHLYPWTYVQQAVPLSSHFLVWDMSKADQTFVLPVLVAASMWLQQKLTMPLGASTAASSSQTQTNQMLLWTMPLMFGWITLTVPTGLALYWMISNAVGVAMNYYVFGWQGKGLRAIFLSSGSGTPVGGVGVNAGGSRVRDQSNLASTDNASGIGPVSTNGSQAGKRDLNERKRRGRGKR